MVNFKARLEKAFEPRPNQKKWGAMELTFYRLCFELLRNLLILGLLIFFYAKTRSTFLFVVTLFTYGLLVAFIWSHVETWVVYPIYRLIEPKIPFKAMLVIHIAIALLIMAGLYFTVYELAFTVAEGYAG